MGSSGYKGFSHFPPQLLRVNVTRCGTGQGCFSLLVWGKHFDVDGFSDHPNQQHGDNLVIIPFIDEETEIIGLYTWVSCQFILASVSHFSADAAGLEQGMKICISNKSPAADNCSGLRVVQ